jgi:hypothetical protein
MVKGFGSENRRRVFYTANTKKQGQLLQALEISHQATPGGISSGDFSKKTLRNVFTPCPYFNRSSTVVKP